MFDLEPKPKWQAICNNEFGLKLVNNAKKNQSDAMFFKSLAKFNSHLARTRFPQESTETARTN